MQQWLLLLLLSLLCRPTLATAGEEDADAAAVEDADLLWSSLLCRPTLATAGEEDADAVAVEDVDLLQLHRRLDRVQLSRMPLLHAIIADAEEEGEEEEDAIERRLLVPLLLKLR